jgi:hypothetical protein
MMRGSDCVAVCALRADGCVGRMVVWPVLRKGVEVCVSVGGGGA